MQVAAHRFVTRGKGLRPCLADALDLLFVAQVGDLVLQRSGLFRPWDRGRGGFIPVLGVVVVVAAAASDQAGRSQCYEQ